MKRFVEGADRTQVTLLPECLDDYVAAPVRVIDVFVEELDLHEFGFMRAEPASTARDFEDRLLHIAHEHAQAQRG